MKMQEAMRIIDGDGSPNGYMVSFWRLVDGGRMKQSDHFPDKNAGEPLIASEEEARELAAMFASKTKGRCVDIEVIDANWRPVMRGGFKYNSSSASGKPTLTEMEKQIEMGARALYESEGRLGRWEDAPESMKDMRRRQAGLVVRAI